MIKENGFCMGETIFAYIFDGLFREATRKILSIEFNIHTTDGSRIISKR